MTDTNFDNLFRTKLINVVLNFLKCGYILYKIIIYGGKQPIKEATKTVVYDLCENYLYEERTYVTDNFYTSVHLAEQMLSKNT